MTWAEFIKVVKQMAFPDKEPSNLAYNHTRYILDGIIELQKRIPQLRDRNFNSIAFGDTFYQCRATVIDPKPNGPLIRLYTYTAPDHCDRVFYHPTTREHMESLMRTCGTEPSPEGALVGPEPRDYFKALGDIPGVNTAVEVEPTVARIEFTPSALIGGSTSVGTITLLAPAPVGGVVVALASTNPLVVKIPASVTVRAGSSTATFPIETEEVDASLNVKITATLGSRGIALDLQVHDVNVTTDKGWRSPSGYYAVIGAQVYVWPHIESNEHLVIEWSGIKMTYDQLDQILFEKDVQSVVELYVQAQAALREDCDKNQFATLQASWNAQAAQLAWWYRTKDLLPESPWRQQEDCPCPTSTTTTSVPPPDPGPEPEPKMYDIYLGNAGGTAPPSYTAEEVIAMENGSFGNTVARVILAWTDYQIAAPADGQNQYRLICIPVEMYAGEPSFRSAGFDLPMNLMPDKVVINGLTYNIFRTSVRSAGDFTKAGHTAISIIP